MPKSTPPPPTPPAAAEQPTPAAKPETETELDTAKLRVDLIRRIGEFDSFYLEMLKGACDAIDLHCGATTPVEDFVWNTLFHYGKNKLDAVHVREIADTFFEDYATLISTARRLPPELLAESPR